MSSKGKIFLATPCYGGLCLEQYFISILQLQILLSQRGYQLLIDTTENESLVHRARNVSIGRFMQKTDADFSGNRIPVKNKLPFKKNCDDFRGNPGFL